MSEDTTPQPETVRAAEAAFYDRLSDQTDIDIAEHAARVASRVVERATPPAPDPDALIEAIVDDYFAGSQVGPFWRTTLTEILERRLAGLQAPPTPDPEQTCSTCHNSKCPITIEFGGCVFYNGHDGSHLTGREVEGYRTACPECGKDWRPKPQVDEPTGWANRYEGGWTRPVETPAAAEQDALCGSGPDALEVAVPLYRRPGVQTPTVGELLASVRLTGRLSDGDARIGWTRTELDEVLRQSPPATADPAIADPVAIRLGLVESPPATPEPDHPGLPAALRTMALTCQLTELERVILETAASELEPGEDWAEAWVGDSSVDEVSDIVWNTDADVIDVSNMDPVWIKPRKIVSVPVPDPETETTDG